MRARHRDAMLALAEDAAPHLVSADQVLWLDRVDRDSANLAAAIEHAAATDPQAALRLCIAVTVLWKARGRFVEAEAAYVRALDAAGDDAPALRARALWGLSLVATYGGAWDVTPLAAATEALELARELGELSTAARALDSLATLQIFSDPVGAIGVAEEAIALAREAGDDWCFISAHHAAAFALFFMDRFDEVEVHYDAVESLIEFSGYREFAAWQQHLRALRKRREGDLVGYREHSEHLVTIAREIGEPSTECAALGAFATIAVETGDGDGALRIIDDAFAVVYRTSEGIMRPYVEQTHGWVLAALGRHDEAAARLTATLPVVGYAWVRANVMLVLARVRLAQSDMDEARAHAE